jgi:hypothetical protein
MSARAWRAILDEGDRLAFEIQRFRGDPKQLARKIHYDYYDYKPPRLLGIGVEFDPNETGVVLEYHDKRFTYQHRGYRERIEMVYSTALPREFDGINLASLKCKQCGVKGLTRRDLTNHHCGG